jgi:hypothetical protein
MWLVVVFVLFHFVSCLLQFCFIMASFCSILAPFWLHFGFILASFWLRFCFVFVSFHFGFDLYQLAVYVYTRLDGHAPSADMQAGADPGDGAAVLSALHRVQFDGVSGTVRAHSKQPTISRITMCAQMCAQLVQTSGPSVLVEEL